MIVIQIIFLEIWYDNYVLSKSFEQMLSDMIQQIIINSLFNKSFGPESRALCKAASRILCDLPSCRDLLCELEKSVNLWVLQFIHL